MKADFETLQERIEELKQEKTRQELLREHLLGELSVRFGCSSMEAAKKLLAKKERQQEKSDAEYKEWLDNFLTRFAEFID
jgi:hypothetical protein